MGAHHGKKDSLVSKDDLEQIYDKIKNDNLDEIKEIMDNMETDDKVVEVLTSERLQPVIAALECSSMKSLKYFLDLYKMYQDKFEEFGHDQTDGIIDLKHVNNNQNVLHSVAKQDRQEGQAGCEAASILKQYPDIVKCIANKADKYGTPPLLTAVRRNNTAVATLLVQNGSCFNQNFKGPKTSPINIAVTMGQDVILKEMIQKMTDKSEKSGLFSHTKLFGKGHTILYPAAASGNDEIFRFLWKEMNEEEARTNLKKEISHETECQLFLKHISSCGMTFAMEKLMELNEEWAVGLSEKAEDEELSEKDEELTPLMWAVKENQIEMFKLILKKDTGRKTINIEDTKGRNVFHYAAEASTPEFLNDLMGYSQFYNEKDKSGCSPLHLAAVKDLRENVEKLFEHKNNMSNESIFHCELCVKACSCDMLSFILEKYENSEQTNLFKIENKEQQTPLHLAAFAGRTDILKLYVEKDASVELRSTYFHWTALHFAVAGKSLTAVEFLVGKSKDMVNWRSDDDETPAVLAAEAGNAPILKFLLENGANVFGKYPKENLLDCVTHYSHVSLNNRADTALEIIRFCDEHGGIDRLKQLMQDNSVLGNEAIMSKLIKEMPSVAYEILNRCFKTIKAKDQEQYHFFPLQSQAKKQRVGKNLEVIHCMIKYKCDSCLGHPVVVKFLDEMWSKSTAKLWYIANVILYTAFLFSMTAYICLQMRGSYELTSPELIALSLVSVVVISFNILKEIVQMPFSWKEYFLYPNNYLEWLMYVSALFYLVPPNKRKTDAQIQAGATAVLLAWINFIWFFKRLSGFGIYIIMAKKMFITLLKVLPMVILFIFAFSMAFFLLRSNDEGFDSIPIAMLTTSVMMVGEIDYRSVFLDNQKGPYIKLQQIFLFCFLLIITIVIMNLFVGLAVGDTDKIMKRSKDEERINKASLIVAMERSPVIKLCKIDDPLTVNVKDEKKKQPWYVKLWEMVYRDTERDDEVDNKEILSKLERVESSIARIATALEKLTNSKNQPRDVKVKTDDNDFTEDTTL